MPQSKQASSELNHKINIKVNKLLLCVALEQPHNPRRPVINAQSHITFPYNKVWGLKIKARFEPRYDYGTEAFYHNAAPINIDNIIYQYSKKQPS